ncbi:DUF4150 domain-containing protein [Diaphorobacter sp. HDW4A]|uniref:PAAR-like domain-containing protein n=1 Tax=Diaphorobacter sp. HDW4A TaxID=2714924 RepID=UPI00140E2ADC|nr:PAAR-like domain-containing protein [Diaphorobacter sp. HDW4A]QIL80761.1 DUF4150 domain-containing protein [Diaphorobacter sp. HDW4A]
METYVYANDNEFCSKAADGVSRAATPDPCWTPPPPSGGPILVSYSNTAYARGLENGTTTVFVCGTPVAKKDQSYLANSTGNEEATWTVGQGFFTHVITGKAYFVDWSPDVKVEGLNVDRHTDPMTHNHA